MLTLLPTDLPGDLSSALQALGYTSQRFSQEALECYAAELYRRKTLSLEQAAHLAQMSLWNFLPFLSEQGIPIADYDEESTAQELETAHWLTSRP